MILLFICEQYCCSRKNSFKNSIKKIWDALIKGTKFFKNNPRKLQY